MLHFLVVQSLERTPPNSRTPSDKHLLNLAILMWKITHFSRTKSFFIHLSWCNLTRLTLWSIFENWEFRFCGFFIFLCALCVSM